MLILYKYINIYINFKLNICCPVTLVFSSFFLVAGHFFQFTNPSRCGYNYFYYIKFVEIFESRIVKNISKMHQFQLMESKKSLALDSCIILPLI